MSEDEIKQRQHDLYHELRTLMSKVHRVNLELGNLQVGVEPPVRDNDGFMPEFIRKVGVTANARWDGDDVPDFLKKEAV